MGNAIDISTLSVSAQTVGQAEEQSPEPGTVTVGETAPEEETGTEETGTEEGTGTESETPIKAEDGSTGTLHQDANGDGVCDCGEDCAYKTRFFITTQPQGGKVTCGDITCSTDTAEVTMHYQVPVKLKEGQTVTLKSNTLPYGGKLSQLTFNDAVFVDNAGTEVSGTLAWQNPDFQPTTSGTADFDWEFTVGDKYESVMGTVSVMVEKRQAVITIESGKETYHKTVGDAVVTVDATGMVTIHGAGSAAIVLSLPESANYYPNACDSNRCRKLYRNGKCRV